MGISFVNIFTLFEELGSKKKQIIERGASLITEAITDRINSGNLTRNTEKDLKNLINTGDFSEKEQIEILIKAIVLIGMNNNKSSRKDDDDDYRFNTNKKIKSRSDIFGR